MQKKQRKYRNLYPTGSFEDISFEDVFQEYEEHAKKVAESHQKLYRETLSKGKCFSVSFKGIPDSTTIIFAKNKDKAKYQAFKYFRDNFHPEFIGNKGDLMLKGYVKRLPIFDEYDIEGKIPIPVLMRELDMKFPCSICKKHHFSYDDYDKGRCFILEGEGDADDYIKGYVLCYDCRRRLCGWPCKYP